MDLMNAVISQEALQAKQSQMQNILKQRQGSFQPKQDLSATNQAESTKAPNFTQFIDNISASSSESVSYYQGNSSKGQLIDIVV